LDHEDAQVVVFLVQRAEEKSRPRFGIVHGAADDDFAVREHRDRKPFARALLRLERRLVVAFGVSLQRLDEKDGLQLFVFDAPRFRLRVVDGDDVEEIPRGRKVERLALQNGSVLVVDDDEVDASGRWGAYGSAPYVGMCLIASSIGKRTFMPTVF